MPMRTCPEWNPGELVEHVGQTQRWVASLVENRVQDPGFGACRAGRPQRSYGSDPFVRVGKSSRTLPTHGRKGCSTIHQSDSRPRLGGQMRRI